MRQAIVSVIAATSLLASSLPALAEGAPAMAAPAKHAGPLAPGGAAGVQQAQGISDVPWVFVVGLSLLATSVALAFLQNNDDTTSTPATTTTTTN